MQDFIDMTAEYVFIQHVSGNRPKHIFVQYTDNEDFCDALEEQVVLLNEAYGRRRNVHLYPTPLKAATVSDFTQDIPAHVVSGKLDVREPSEIQALLRDWVCATLLKN